MRSDDVLVYLHIPKTGGSSIIAILDEQFSKDEIFPLHSPTAEDYFFAFTLKELRRFRFVRGHFFFGPYDAHIYKHLIQNPICATMLRDPVQRTISEYRHVRRVPHHRLHHGLATSDNPLQDFLTQPEYNPLITNRQIRLVIGAYPFRPSGLNRPNTISDEAFLTWGKQKLEQFAFVGLMERFEESVQLLMHTFRWRPPREIPRLNVATDSFSEDTISEDALEIIRARTELDRELYTYAETLFEERLVRMREELSRHDSENSQSEKVMTRE